MVGLLADHQCVHLSQQLNAKPVGAGDAIKCNMTCMQVIAGWGFQPCGRKCIDCFCMRLARLYYMASASECVACNLLPSTSMPGVRLACMPGVWHARGCGDQQKRQQAGTG